MVKTAQPAMVLCNSVAVPAFIIQQIGSTWRCRKPASYGQEWSDVKLEDAQKPTNSYNAEKQSRVCLQKL